MRCSEFKDLHCAYIDDTLAGVELVRMQGHIAECSECALLDINVRRSLMLVHSLPPIEPSADFSLRLDERLRECRLNPGGASSAGFRMVATVGAIASLMMLGYVADTMRSASSAAKPPADIVFPPAIAMAIPPDTTPAPSIVASVSAGLPIWPAALLVEQGGLQTVSYTQAR